MEIRPQGTAPLPGTASSKDNLPPEMTSWIAQFPPPSAQRATLAEARSDERIGHDGLERLRGAASQFGG